MNTKTKTQPNEPGFYNLEIGYENSNGTAVVVAKSYVHFNGSYNTRIMNCAPDGKILNEKVAKEILTRRENKILSWELERKGW